MSASWRTRSMLSSVITAIRRAYSRAAGAAPRPCRPAPSSEPRLLRHGKLGEARDAVPVGHSGQIIRDTLTGLPLSGRQQLGLGDVVLEEHPHHLVDPLLLAARL